MKVEKNSGMFPAWLDNFISNYGNSKKKVAETNVESLPTVNWKNETYYVQDKGNGVTLYTKYGNIVRFIPDSELNSELVAQNERVKAVNQLLQEDNVVASLDEKADSDVDVDLDLTCGGCDTEACDDVVADEEFENELEKVADLEDGLPQETEETEPTTETATETEETQTSTDEATTASVSEGIEDMTGVPSEGIEDMVGEVSEGIEDVVENTATIEPETCPECGAECSDGECACDCADCAEETVQIPTEEFVTKASYNRLLAKVKQLEKTIKAFSEAQHAYTAPENNAYDLSSQDAEVNHFQEAAETTQKVIDKEHELDLSNMSDRAKLNENFLEDLLSVDAENFNEVMEEIKEPATTEEIPAEQVEETPVEELVEAPVDETVEIEEEAPAEEVGEELPVEETPTDDIVVVEEDELPVVEEMSGVPQIYMLDDPKQIEEFTVQTCPMCHAKKSLNGVERIAGVVGVVCKHCGQEFAVTDDAIYINKNK